MISGNCKKMNISRICQLYGYRTKLASLHSRQFNMIVTLLIRLLQTLDTSIISLRHACFEIPKSIWLPFVQPIAFGHSLQNSVVTSLLNFGQQNVPSTCIWKFPRAKLFLAMPFMYFRYWLWLDIFKNMGSLQLITQHCYNVITDFQITIWMGWLGYR